MKNLLKYTEKLKHLPRTGWLRHNITTPETVASHSWQMAMMALKLAENKETGAYDMDKVIKMCLCHDIGESIIGDITPSDSRYASKEEEESKAIEKIATESDFYKVKALFDEYEENKTPEAKLANDLDKLDMFAQSLAYEEKYQGKDLTEFRESAVKAIQTDIGKKLLKELSA